MNDYVYCMHGFVAKLLPGVRPETYAASDGCYIYTEVKKGVDTENE